MRRIRSVVAVAATMVAMLAFSVPAVADVDFDGDRHDKYEDRYDRYEEEYEDRLDEYEDRLDDYHDALEEAYDKDGFFYHIPFVGYDYDDIEDVLDID